MAIPDYFDLYGGNIVEPPKPPPVNSSAFTGINDPVARANKLRAAGAPAAAVAAPVQPSPAPAPTAPAPTTPAPTAAKGARSMLSVSNVGKLAKGNLALAPVVGAVGGALDSTENVRNFAGSLGLDYNSFGGRVGANALNVLQKIGNAATFGGASFLSERLGRVFDGGSFFDPYQPAAPSAPVAAAVPATVAESPQAPLPSVPPLPVPEAAAPAAVPAQQFQSTVPYSPITRSVARDGSVLITGSGQSQDYLARRAGALTAPRSAAGAFAGAALNLKQIAGDNAQRLATAKAALEGQTKGAQALKDLSAAHISAANLQLAQQVLAKGGSAQEAAAALHGRIAAGDRFTIPSSALVEPGKPVPVLNTRTGAVTLNPQQSRASIAKGTDGKFYVLDTAGKATREATAAERAQMK